MFRITGRVSAEGYREGREVRTLEFIESRLKEYGVREVYVAGNELSFTGVRHRLLQLTPYSVTGGVLAGDINLQYSGSTITARYTLKLNPYPSVMAFAFLAGLLATYLIYDVTFSVSHALLFVAVAALFGLLPYWSLRRRMESFLTRALLIATYRDAIH